VGETPGMTRAAIGRLRQQVQGLIDADLILPEDGQWLMAALNRTLQSLPEANAQPSRSDMQGFIERLQSLMQTGVLDVPDGQPPVDLARGVLAALRGHGERAVATG
jgi:hypothetical protein